MQTLKVSVWSVLRTKVNSYCHFSASRTNARVTNVTKTSSFSKASEREKVQGFPVQPNVLATYLAHCANAYRSIQVERRTL